MGRLLQGMQSVSDFMNDAIKAFDGKDFAKSLYGAAPWWGQAMADAAGEAFPLIGFVLKFSKKLMKDDDPEKQGYAACTMAYNRAVEQAVCSLSTQLTPQKLTRSATRLKSEMPAEIKMDDFSFDETAFQHPFITHSDKVFREFTKATGLDVPTTNKLMNKVHRRFLRNLRFLLAHPKTADKFAAFAQLLRWNATDYLNGRALEDHLDYQSWSFNEAPVFGREPFALTHIYTDTDCGYLTYDDIRNGKDPFSEAVVQRIDLLEKVLQLIADESSNEPIIVWGVAGAGKSAFTLRLTSELIDAGLTPIRVALGDLDVSSNLLESLPIAVRLGGKNFGPSGFEKPFDPQWFKKLVDNNESAVFRDNQISPYVLIFDGWDEISTGATAGFRDDVNRVLGEIRSKFIDPRSGRKRPKICVIITGRPSVDVTKTRLFEAETPILTIRPFTPNQLQTCISHFTKARRTWPVRIRSVDVTEKTFVRDESWFSGVVSAYADGFNEMQESHRQGTVRAEPTGSMGVVGLPLLAHLALRLMVEVGDSKHLSALIRSPTTLYRALVDMTYEKGAKFSSAEILGNRRHRLIGADLRVLLWHVAAAITATGGENISREELRLRLKWDDKTLRRIVEDATKLEGSQGVEKRKENVLARLIIGFFFKEGTDDQGCQFMHKSFREYLFAEGIVEILKKFGTDKRVLKKFAKKSAPGFQERDVYWKDFEDESQLPPDTFQDPRYHFTHSLAELFATKWISPEIKSHVCELIEWEVGRDAQAVTRWPGKATDPITKEQWQYVRDGLADVWDWWAEGVLLRPKPMLAGIQENATFACPYVVELSHLCSPLDHDRWKEELPDVARLITVDARVGEAFFHLNAVVHSAMIHQQLTQISSARFQTGQCEQRRRYQVVMHCDAGSLVLFAPSGEDGRYFMNFCARMNAPGWRPEGAFPTKLYGRCLYLASVDLGQLRLAKADLSGAFLIDANLSGTDLTSVNFDCANLTGANLSFSHSDTNGPSFRKASLSNAIVDSANLGSSSFFETDFSKATIKRSRFVDSSFEGCNFNGAQCSRNDFQNSQGVPPEIRDADDY